MRARPAPRTFRSGELAPWLDGLSNEITQSGCRTLENFIVRKQGQAMRRPGTFFVNEVKDSADATVLVPVTIDDDNSYVLEIGDEYIRFYKDHARITYSGTTTIYEVTSPWSTGDVSDLRWQYMPTEKAIRFVCANGAYAMRQLAWTADADWSLTQVPIWGAPPLLGLSARGQSMRTEDGESWEFGRIQNAITTAVAYGRKNFVAANTSGVFYVSSDGETWIETLNLNRNLTIINIVGTPAGDFIAVGGAASGLMYVSHDDGVTWETGYSHSSTAPYFAIGYDAEKNYYRVAGYSIGIYSDDGLTWTTITETTNAKPFDIKYADSLWLSARGTRLYSAESIASPWTLVLSGTEIYFGSRLAPGKPLGSILWVSSSWTSTDSGIILASSDGVAWTVVFTASAAFGDVIWAGNRYYLGGDWANRDAYANLYWVSETGQSWSTVALTVNYTKRVQSFAISLNEQLEWFRDTNHFPSVIGTHENRIVIANTLEKTATVWGSKTNAPNNFYPGEFADEAYQYGISAERNVDIRWLIGGVGGLLIGTRTAEGIMLGSPDEGITPNTAQFRWLSTFGSANIQPVRVNNTIVFIQRGREIVRGYIPQVNTYESAELTFFADHIGKGGLTSIDRQEDPQNLVYFIRSDGQMPALTMETALVAWARIRTASTSLSVGIIESVAVIPTDGAEDEIWQIANRKTDAGTIRCIEYYDSLAVSSLADAHYVDCGVNPTNSVTFAAVGALTHLAGENVDALIDGLTWVSGLTVAAAGTITVAPHSGTNIHVGLPYASYLQTMRGDYGSPWGAGAGLNKRTSDLLVWVHDSSALATFGPTTALATETIAYPSSTTLITDVVKVNFPGQWDRDNYIWCIVTDPRPFTLVAMAPDSETGDR